MAFDNGDIGYMLLSTMPKRKNSYPYLGCSIIDGTSSEHDWTGYYTTSELPRVVNPRKGYIVAANNRVVPDNVETDVGATVTSTVRAQRINELIQDAIASGTKLSYQDMISY